MAKLISADLTNNKLCILEYTTTDGQMLSFEKDAFDAKIVSHTYTDKGKIIFDKPITKIGECAFSWCKSLTSVTIPDSVTTIGIRAFEGCCSLKSVTIPDCVTTIGEAAFAYCSSITSVTIGDSVTTIGDYTFRNCSSLTSVTIPDSVTTIGDRAFYGCSSLTSITIPDSVTTIGYYTFEDCTGELVVNCNIPSASFGWPGSFQGSNFTSVTIGDSVTSIGDYAFRNCSSLTSVTIPDSVTTIGRDAFDGCSSLTSVYITDLSAWCKIDFGSSSANPLYYAENIYLNNESVTELVIPSDITEIKSYAFSECKSLKNITIGKGVSVIGKESFKGCNIDTIVCYPKIPPKIDDSFRKFENLIVPTGCEEAYANSDWGQYLE